MEISFFNNASKFENLSSVPSNCFNNCKALTSFNFGANLTALGNTAFQNCTTLAGSVNLQYVTSIGGWCFQGCTTITGVTFSSNLTSIGTCAFNGCSKLTGAISVPASVGTVGYGAFRHTDITSLTFLGDSTEITPGVWSTNSNYGVRTVR